MVASIPMALLALDIQAATRLRWASCEVQGAPAFLDADNVFSGTVDAAVTLMSTMPVE